MSSPGQYFRFCSSSSSMLAPQAGARFICCDSAARHREFLQLNMLRGSRLLCASTRTAGWPWRAGPSTASCFARRAFAANPAQRAEATHAGGLIKPGDLEQKNVLSARGTIIRPKEPGSLDLVLEDAGKLRKLDLCRNNNLQPRDAGRRSQLLIRPGTILFAGYSRAIIRSDKMLLLEALEKDVQPVETGQPDEGHFTEKAQHLKAQMRKIMVRDRLTMREGSSDFVPFEFVALEAVLADTVHRLLLRSEACQQGFDELVHTLSTSETIPTAALQSMLEVKDSVEELKNRSQELQTAVNDVLREEADMASMYLSDRAQNKARNPGDDEEIELLLETYRHHAYSSTTLADTLLTRLQSINNHVTLLLSSTRNRLLNLEITIAFATLGMGVAGYVGAIFGMNLHSGLEDEPHLFAVMTVASITLALAVMRIGRRALVRARSIKGEQQGILRRPPPGTS